MTRCSEDRGSAPRKLLDMDPGRGGGLKGRALRIARLMSFAFSNFMANNSLLRATALSFTTLLSLVPLLALTFSVLKGFGAQSHLVPMVLEHAAAGSDEVVRRIISYIDNTNMGSVGAIGLAFLLLTSVNMLGSVEEAFNAVWGVTETRSFYRKFSDYLSVLVSAPILILAATSVTTTLQSEQLFTWFMEQTYFGDLFLALLKFAPFVIAWLALFVLYTFMPNTRVRYGSALVGAIFAGTLWQLAQWVYIHFQVGAANYNAIYGTLAALPILMMWIFVSWIIVLFGMEVTAAHQSLRTFRRGLHRGHISQSLREFLALAVLRHIAAAFREGKPGWGEQHLAVKLRVPLRIIRETLEQLMAAGFIVPAGDGFFLPARDPERIELAEVLEALRSHGASCELEEESQVRQILDQAQGALRETLQGLTLKELAAAEKSRPGVDKEGGVDI
jgi:membrane protein